MGFSFSPSSSSSSFLLKDSNKKRSDSQFENKGGIISQ